MFQVKIIEMISRCALGNVSAFLLFAGINAAVGANSLQGLRAMALPGGQFAVVAVVRNEQKAARDFHVSADRGDKCTVDNPSPLGSGNDHRLLERPVIFGIDGQGWVAKWVVIETNRRDCVMRMAAGPLEKEVSIQEWRPPVLTRAVRPPTTPGSFIFEATVVEEQFAQPTGEPAGLPIQVQVLIKNSDATQRHVAIRNRTVTCTNGAQFDWVVGPGEPPSAIGAGPQVVAPRDWIVLSQRLRGTGKAADCRVILGIAERLQTELGNSQWVSTGDVSLSLKATARALYQ